MMGEDSGSRKSVCKETLYAVFLWNARNIQNTSTEGLIESDQGSEGIGAGSEKIKLC